MEDNILAREDITENVIAIKINQAYRENMTELELYEVTRGCWKVDVKRAEKADYAFCIYKGIIKEVYKIKEWLPAGSIPRPTLPDAETPADRFEFVGEIAEENIRDKYIEKSIANLYRRGEANPIKYYMNETYKRN